MPWVTPLTLESEFARLEPLRMEHREELCAAVRDGELWRLWYTTIPTADRMEAEIERRLGLQERGSMVPFTVFRADGRVAGMTTYMNIDATNRRLEIGSTWYAKSCQRTPLNTACKLMLLQHAFLGLNSIAVEFRTNFFNEQSRKAIERLGAKLDGILRSHMIMPNGLVRDTCVYSILAGEWPAVEANLMHRLQR